MIAKLWQMLPFCHSHLRVKNGYPTKTAMRVLYVLIFGRKVNVFRYKVDYS